MKRGILSLAMLMNLAVLPIGAQSKFISSTPMETENRLADLNGNSGILILSKRRDLVVSVVNSSKATVSPKGKRKDGLYAYEVVIGADDTSSPNIEVSRRGDINRINMVPPIKANYFYTYRVEEVDRPITMENQTTQGDLVADASLAEVEILTTLSDLVVTCPPQLQAKVTKSQKAGDKSVNVTSVVFPVAILQAAKKKAEDARKHHKDLEYKYVENPTKMAVSERQWAELDAAEKAADDAEAEMYKLRSIEVYASNTNHLPIDVIDMTGREKKSYGILQVQMEKPSECAIIQQEAGKLFAQRKYAEAKKMFFSSLRAEGMAQYMVPAVKANMAQCDTCVYFENYIVKALGMLDDMKRKASGTQTQVVEVFSTMLDAFNVLEKYNPCEFYEKRIKSLEDKIGEMPLDFKFTFVKWMNSYSGFSESGVMPNVEVWAYYGDEEQKLNRYSSDRKFRNLVSRSDQYRQVGISDGQGVATLHLLRKNLPSGFFFRPIGYKDKARIVYMDTTDLMARQKESYNKLQLRQKMYVAN